MDAKDRLLLNCSLAQTVRSEQAIGTTSDTLVIHYYCSSLIFWPTNPEDQNTLDDTTPLKDRPAVTLNPVRGHKNPVRGAGIACW